MFRKIKKKFSHNRVDLVGRKKSRLIIDEISRSNESNKNIGLYLLTSILFVFSFPNFIILMFTKNILEAQCDFSWLAWISLVPFVIAIDREKKISAVIKNSFISGLTIFTLGMYWLTEVTVIGYLILILYVSIYIVAFAII